MRNIPFSIGVVHFVGIGGVGMSGIAEVMHNLGYKVQGSDIAHNAHVKRLRDLGVCVAIGHHDQNVAGVGVVVVSSAVHEFNPEVQGLDPAYTGCATCGDVSRIDASQMGYFHRRHPRKNNNDKHGGWPCWRLRPWIRRLLTAVSLMHGE